MRLTGSRAYTVPNYTPKMPTGLVELMEGLTKDVLKHNPDNVYEFCAGHMQKLLEIRNGDVPKKLLSLDQKISRAQEKVRKRYKNRQQQMDKEMETRLSKIEQVEIVTAPPKKEIVTDDPKKEIVTDDPKKEIVTDDPKKEIVTDNSKNEIVIDDPKKEIVTDAPKKSTEIEAMSESDKGSTTDEKILNKPVVVVQSLDHQSLDDESESTKLDVENIQIAVNEVSEDKNKANDHFNNLPSEDQLKEDEKSIENQYFVSKTETHSFHPIEISEDSINGKSFVVELEDYKSEKMNDEYHTSDDSIPMNDTIKLEIENNELIDVVKKHDENLHSDTGMTTMETDNNLEESNKEMSKHAESDVNNDISDYEFNLDNEKESNRNNSGVKNNEMNVTLNENEDPHQNTISEITETIENDTLSSELKYLDGDKANLTHNHLENVMENAELISNNINDVEKVVDSPVKQPGVENTDMSTEVVVGKENLSENHHGSEDTTETTPTNTNIDIKQSPNICEENIEKTVFKPLTFEDTELHDAVVILNNKDVDLEANESQDIPTTTYELNSKSILKENSSKDSNVSTTTKLNENNDNENAEMDSNSGMDLETAAITIQKVFRTFLFSKSRASTLDDTVNENSLDEDVEKKEEPDYLIKGTTINKERRTLGLSRMDTVLQTVNEEKSLSLSTDDSSTLSSAATTIQAHVRGFLVRNRLNSNKTASSSSLVNSDGTSTKSLEGDTNEHKKTILNIHIVPERGQFMSRDESMLTSIDLPLDTSPPCSVNLHPLGYDKSEPRKQLKREDAVQSISPPSNNSGKLSEDVESIKDVVIDDNNIPLKQEQDSAATSLSSNQELDTESCETTLTISSAAETVIEVDNNNEDARHVMLSPENVHTDVKRNDVINSSSDEMDVVTPSLKNGERNIPSVNSDENPAPKLVHSGEFHDIVVQTQVKRSESSVVREFKNVLVYFLLWDKT